MATQPLRVGVIGCGFIAQSIHIPCLAKSRGAKLVAACEKKEELARTVAREFKIDKYYSETKPAKG